MSKNAIEEALDKSLKALQSLDTDESEEDLAKAKAKAEEAEEPEEEEEEEEAAPETDEEEEEEEEGEKKEKSEDSADLVDAVPVLKAVVAELEATREALAELQKSFATSNKAVAMVLKSIVEAEKAGYDMAKSTMEAVEVLRSVPHPRKGVAVEGEIMRKAFEGEAQVTFTRAQVKDAMMKAFQANEVDARAISHAEMNDWNLEVIPSAVKARLTKKE